MTINQTNKRAMFGKVAAIINQHIVLFAGLSAFASAFERFQNLLEIIDVAANDKAGEFKMRDASEETLINSLMDIGSALVAYASKAKLTDVKIMAVMKRSELERMPLEDLGQKAKSISELASRYAMHLAAHGADANKLAKLNAALTKFLAAAATCNAGTERTGTVISLRDLFQEADTVLREQLDKMVETLKRKHPEFYRKYQTARVICAMGESQLKEESVVDATVAVL